MTVERALMWFCRAGFLGVFFALCSVSVCLIWNWLFGSNNSPWLAAVAGGVMGLLTSVFSWLYERLPLLPERGKYKQRLRELQAERECLAQGETRTD